MKSTNPRPLRAIIHRAANDYRVTPEDILGRRRDELAVAARAEVIHWARRHNYSLPFLGQYFRRDSTTILAAERRHERALEMEGE